MEQIECSETSAIINQTTGNHPKKTYYILNMAKAWNQEEYKRLLNVTQSSLILTNTSQEPAVSTRWMETADSSIMPVYVYYQMCGVMSEKTVIYKEHAASIFWRWKQQSLWTVGSHIMYLPECKTTLIWENPLKKIRLPREYVFLQIQDDPANIKSAEKTFYCYYAFIFLTPTPEISIPFTVISQYIISPIHYTECTAHLKTLHSHFWWDALPCCYDRHWLKNTCIFFWFINLLELIKIHSFLYKSCHWC
jgi:hypothetical protein